jgi:hypothetical protein
MSCKHACIPTRKFAAASPKKAFGASRVPEVGRPQFYLHPPNTQIFTQARETERESEIETEINK